MNRPAAASRSDAPSPHPRRRWLLPLGVGLLAFAMGWAWMAAPAQLAQWLSGKVIERAARRGLTVHIGHSWLDPTDQWVLDDVVVSDPAMPRAPLLHVRRIAVDFEIDGVLRPRVFLQRLTVVEPKLQVRREADGHSNFQSLLDALTRPQGDKDQHGGGWRRYLSAHVPTVQVRGLQVQVDDESGGPLRIGGVDVRHLRFDGAADVSNQSPVQEKVRLDLHASARVAGVARPLRLDSHIDVDEGGGEVTLQLPSDVSVAVDGWHMHVGSVTLRGALLGKGLPEVAFGQVRLAHNSPSAQVGLDTREIVVAVSPLPVHDVAIPQQLQASLTGPLRQVLRFVRQVTIREPVVIVRRQQARALAEELHAEVASLEHAVAEVEAVGPGPQAAVPLASAETSTAEGAVVRESLVAMFSKGADRLQGRVEALRATLATVPVPLLVIEHGAARYHDQVQGPAREMADFSVRVDRQRADGVVTMDMSFRTAAHAARNRMSGRFDAQRGEAEVRFQAEQLPLLPYAAILPQSLHVGAASALRDTDLTVRVQADSGVVTLEGKVAVQDLAVEARRWSRQRIERINGSVSGKVMLDLKAERAAVSQLLWNTAAVQLETSGSIERFRTVPQFKVHAAMPPVACQELVDAMPPGFADTIKGMRCEGRLSFSFDGSLDTADMESLRFDFQPQLDEVKILTLGPQIDFDRLKRPFVHQAIRYRRNPQPGQPAYDTVTFRTGPGSGNWVSLGATSDLFVKVITTTEDGGFFGHNGFLLDAIRSAAVANLKKGRFVRGASTITQQLVKNLFFVEREKTISRKLQEAVVTWQIEKSLSKRQLLELYLNIIELGPGKVYGISAASWHYFKRSSAKLTLLQALWLGSIIPNPRQYYGEFLSGRASPSRRSWLCRIADQMLSRSKIDRAARDRLGECMVVFGGWPDGSEEPGSGGVGGAHGQSSGRDMPRDDGMHAPGVDASQQP